MSDTNIDDVLDLIGFGPMQALMIFTCGMICIYLSNEVMGISLISVSIACEFSMTNSELSMLSSAAFVGLIVASHYSGYKTDKIGRRKVMLYSLSLAIISSLISMAMPSFYWFLLWRFLTGLFVSGASVNNITYITEYTKIKLRPLFVNFISYAFSIGAIYVPVLAHSLEPLQRILFSLGNFDIRVWRLNLLLNAAPGLIAFFALLKLPETAKFMLSVGQTARAYETLNRLCLSNRGQDLESLGVTSITQPNLRDDLQTHGNCLQRLWNDTVPLFKPPYLRSFLLCTLVLCGYFFVGNGLGLWFTKLRQRMPDSNMILCDMIGYSDANNETEASSACSDESINYTDGIFLGCSFFVCCISISLLLLCVRRAHIQFVYAMTAAMCGLSLNLLTYKVPILIAMALFIAISTSAIPLAASQISDVVPTHMRGKAISLSFMFARISVVVANSLIGSFVVAYCLITFNIFVVVKLVVAILTCLLPA